MFRNNMISFVSIDDCEDERDYKDYPFLSHTKIQTVKLPRLADPK